MSKPSEQGTAESSVLMWTEGHSMPWETSSKMAIRVRVSPYFPCLICPPRAWAG